MRPEGGEAEGPPSEEEAPALKRKKRPNKNKKPKKRKRLDPEDELSERDALPIDQTEEH